MYNVQTVHHNTYLEQSMERLLGKKSGQKTYSVQLLHTEINMKCYRSSHPIFCYLQYFSDRYNRQNSYTVSRAIRNSLGKKTKRGNAQLFALSTGIVMFSRTACEIT